MKLRSFLMLLLTAAMPAMAQNAGLRGSIIEADTGNPISGAVVALQGQPISATTDLDGRFVIVNAPAGPVRVVAMAAGYADAVRDTELFSNQTVDLGFIALQNNDLNSVYYEESQDMWLDENLLADDETSSQSITALTSASDDIYYNAQGFNFQPMYFRYRGYDSQFQTTYINGIEMNELGRGRFNFSSLGGMTSRAFRNRTSTLALAPASYGFGDIGGTTNISTITSQYAPGFNGSVSYTNANYMLRAMATYSTGISRSGWGLTISAIARWADEGIVEGTWYNSFGGFLSLEKVLNKNHSITLTAWGVPTERASASPTFQEAMDLAGTNLYNPNWGWQDGKKRSARIVEQFDPTAMLTWLFKTRDVTLTTSASYRWSHYSTSALSWYNCADPRADYYKRLPSAFYDDGEPTVASEYVANLWRTDESYRQIDWDAMYAANYLNNVWNADPAHANDQKGSSYILENRVSNLSVYNFGSVLNYRINPHLSLQSGVSFNYTRGDYFKTVRDLLGGEYWLDINTFSERDYPGNATLLQNNLLNPNAHVGKGDRFGYDYSIYALRASAWLQNIITLPRWDINYGIKFGYTQYQRDGHMMSGVAPTNSYGKGETHRFDTGAIKAGATYKIDGRNFIMAHAQYETRAPLYDYAYVSPRVKDTAIPDLAPERIASFDLSYVWNYRRFRGSISGFWTEMTNMTERTSYYDDQYGTFMNYVLAGVHRRYKGVEIGMAYKVTPSITVSAAGTVASYRYKNRPMGTRSYENNMQPDTTQVVYLKNFHVGGTPELAFNLGIDYAAPKQWFFNINASWMGNAYVTTSPIRHEELSLLWQKFPDPVELEAKMRALASQDKMNDAFVLNASIGKLVYINRKVSLNFNLQAYNLLNNRNIMTTAFQQGRFDYTNYDTQKYSNKYMYAQGIRLFLNVGVRF